eukprot:5156707-Pleurochrysis_carterae.AAC.3
MAVPRHAQLVKPARARPCRSRPCCRRSPSPKSYLAPARCAHIFFIHVPFIPLNSAHKLLTKALRSLQHNLPVDKQAEA